MFYDVKEEKVETRIPSSLIVMNGRISFFRFHHLQNLWHLSASSDLFLGRRRDEGGDHIFIVISIVEH